jgi:putative membrane protein
MPHMATRGMVLAQMWNDGNHMGRGWWWVMGIGWLVVLVTIVVLAVVLVRHFTQNAPARRGAEDVRAERFARGEIDEDEYRRRRDALRG